MVVVFKHDLLQKIDALSYVKYIYMGLMTNQFAGLPIICPPANTTSPFCANGGVNGGDLFLISLGITTVPLYACALVGIGFILVMRIVTWVILRFKP